jgi:hypothetical protein
MNEMALHAKSQGAERKVNRKQELTTNQSIKLSQLERANQHDAEKVLNLFGD